MFKAWNRKYLWLLLILLTTLSPIKPVIADNSAITRPEAFYAPNTNFFNEAGDKVYLDQFEGQTVLLVFWATWCGSCISEMPSLDLLQKDFKQFPFKVIAVSEDFSGMEVIKNHYVTQEIRHLNIYHDYQNQLFRAMSVVGLPTAFLIDKTGKIRVIFKGAVKWHDEEIRKVLLSEIDGNPTPPKNSFKPSSLNSLVLSKKIIEEQKVDPNKHKKNLEIKNENDKAQE